jgi:prepilin-type N-terminal cleavage/methylation domain-containing protein
VTALGPRPSALGEPADARRRGVTLVELLVAIVIVGLLAGVAGVAVRRAPAPSETDRLLAAVAGARRAAVRDRRAATIEIRLGGAPYAVTALPDGGVIADRVVREQLGIDRLTGVALPADESTRAH